MFERFDSDRSRYASLGVVSSLPSGLIDSIWLIIDLNLKGVIPLNDLLHFDLLNNNGKVTVHFSQENSSVEMAIDLPLVILRHIRREFLLLMMAIVKRYYYPQKC